MARAATQKLLISFTNPLDFRRSSLPIRSISVFTSPFSATAVAGAKTAKAKKKAKKEQQVTSSRKIALSSSKAPPLQELLKIRTRSGKEFDEEFLKRFGDKESHIPVMLGEVLDVFESSQLCSFVDCTLGAAGHSSAIIQTHPELQVLVGLDLDPKAHEKARSRINSLLNTDHIDSRPDFKVHMFLKNFREIKQAICEVDQKFLASGVDGILMDLGMSSMQVDDAQRGFSILKNGPLDMRMDSQGVLKAEDILDSWPPAEIGRILRDYGEERNWYHLQNKIVQAREQGGLHSTTDLVKLVRGSSRKQEGRQGWIKTATRVFQALRIAVNDELNTLKDSLHASFDCLRPGGRLAVISFHSLEDRIVKKTFLDIINTGSGDELGEDSNTTDEINFVEEAWIKQTVKGINGVILTKRPVTACIEEERLNVRCRSAKLRVIQKA
ncbi:hypothetical protein V2J09_022859 [Rumex salicifolius]